ncbi:hypothetical protein M408DRAFT_327440 [Serendipita vermifera MAFF 305830]|uniref:phosphatidylinositol-3,4,5-trisphosphate 3-phosphatase n=1 Tax=Serendipita vermifera MAFF 305830 TaxID=933852 RepID=A0A0C2WYL0_SERVB|nr:hypothetical protein M408DRAFT_327440 [Serendipita vermifera MAFF 305830]
MTNYVRRLVSAGKARFRDESLDVELDLVYLTDRVIIMGFPAAGFEGLYRNQRAEVKRFLDTRHGDKYRVFNFCPTRENSYPASTFEGRVSRYPFPDHHAPPLGLLALATQEMKAWLDRGPEHVIVVHCKAGKGRSGTLACSLLLRMDDAIAPPKLKRSYNLSEWADRRADEMMEEVVVETDAAPSSIGEDSDMQSTDKEGTSKTSKENPSSEKPKHSAKGSADQAASTVDKVLHLHTSRRMKQSTGNKHGVSIPSQRRWLRYWSEFLHDVAPPQLPLYPQSKAASPKARLYSIKIRMHEEGGGAQVAIVRVANALIERAPRSMVGSGKGRGAGDVWVSLARYEDPMVEEIERRVRTNEEVEYEDDGITRKNDMFGTPKWDDKKMVRSFARMGVVQGAQPETSLDPEGSVVTHHLLPLPQSEWVEVGSKTTKDEVVMEDIQMNDGILLPSGREVRIKLYVGQLLMGWLWFVPLFHLQQPPSQKGQRTTVVLKRSDVDFPLGYGALLIDIELTLGWDIETHDEELPLQPERSESGSQKEPTTAAVLTALEGNVGPLQAVQD